MNAGGMPLSKIPPIFDHIGRNPSNMELYYQVHTNVGTMGEVRFDEAFMQVLGVKPGDRISFFIDAEGVVTVKGWTNPKVLSGQPTHSAAPRPGDVTQAALFTDAPAPPPKRRISA